MKTMVDNHSSKDLRFRLADQKFSYETETIEPCGREVDENFQRHAFRAAADTVQVTQLKPQIAGNGEHAGVDVEDD